ncbi:MAG: tetratricopeptide repeat protein, partial [Acidobacteria bacterium]|nr:tetratricopeptide repeat protein [Acidobacteriota bacterium]
SYYDLERWQESLQCFEGRVAAVPEHPQAYYYLGRLYRRAGQVEAAQRMFDRHREIRRSREGSGLGVATIED